MARYRKIDPRVWNDEKYRAFSDDGKLAFLFVLTHPAMTAVGAMRGTSAGLAAELGWAPARMVDAISAPISEGMLDVDPVASYIGARNFLRYNEPEGPNSVAKAWLDALDLIPECAAKRAQIYRCRAYLDGKSKAFRDALPDAIWDAFPVAKSDASPIQEQEQEQEPEQEQKKLAGSRARARKAGTKSPASETPAESDPAKANAGGGEGATPQREDGGDAAAAGIAAEPRGAAGPAPSTAIGPEPGQGARPTCPVTPASSRGARPVAADEDLPPPRRLAVANQVDRPLGIEFKAQLTRHLRHGVVVAKAGEEAGVVAELEEILAVQTVDQALRFCLTTARRKQTDIGSLAWCLTVLRDMPPPEDLRPPMQASRWDPVIAGMTPEERSEFDEEKAAALREVKESGVWNSEANRMLDLAEERLWAKWSPRVLGIPALAGGVA